MPISLFSFQDIITSISGIMVLLVLLFAVRLAVVSLTPLPPTPEPPEEGAAALPDRQKEIAGYEDVLVGLRLKEITGKRVTYMGELDRQQTDKMKQEFSDLTAQLGAIAVETAQAQSALTNLVVAIEKKKMRDVIRILPREGGKRPIVVECSMLQIRCQKPEGTAGAEVFSGPDKLELFLDHVRSRRPDASRDFFLLMLKPSCAAYFDIMRNGIKGLGYDVGWDALQEQEVMGFEGDTP